MSGNADQIAQAEAIAAREAEILGKSQRIAPLPIEEVSPESWAALNSFRAIMGLGPANDLPRYSRTLLKHPEIFKRRLEMAATFFCGTIPVRERELAILRIAWLLRAPYEWVEHVAIAQRAGLRSEEIESVTEGSGAGIWTPHEVALLRAVEEMLSNQAVSDEVWEALAQTWGEKQLIEFTMLAGQYVCTAIVQNTLRIRLESGQSGLARR